MTREILILALGAGVVAASLGRGVPKASEAAPAASPARSGRHVWAEARVVARPGSEVAIAPDACGVLSHLLAEKAPVKRGDVVAQLADDEQRAALTEATARVVEAEAPIAFFERELARSTKLQAAGLLSDQAFEKTRHDLDMAKVRRELALATRQHAEVALGHTRLTSPIDGVVVARFAQPGETVVAGKPVVRICDLASARIEAEIDEFDAPGLAVGALATVSAEGHAAHWSGRVEEIPDVIVARALEREGPGEPQGTRVLLAKIALGAPTPLRLGQRCEVDIELPSLESLDRPVPAPAPAREDPAEVHRAVSAITALSVARPHVVENEFVGSASTAITAVGSILALGALAASRRRASTLAGKRLVRISDDGVLGDQDVVLEARAAGRDRACVEIEGGKLEVTSRGGPGVEISAEGLELTIEGVPVRGATAIVHGMVLSVVAGEGAASFVYLDRAASPGEQDRRWVERETDGAEHFRAAEGDSIADVWSEDEIIVIDESVEAGVPDAEDESSEPLLPYPIRPRRTDESSEALLPYPIRPRTVES